MAEDGIGSVHPPAPENTPLRGLEGKLLAGKYELMRLLGEGGMGAVYEGRNAATLKRVAVKVLLSPELAAHPEIVRRFFREARASSVIESDHVVQVYDSGTDPETNNPYMVMELLNGEDLSETVQRLGALEPQVAAKIALQGAMGLAKAHEQGIVHRDIKPANLYLTRRDDGDLLVKVLDFGIAKVRIEQMHEASSGLTQTGSMLGTPLYMSPEQVRGASKIDASADVWSMGVCLYELLTGSTPFANSESLGELMVSIITHDIPLIQDRAPWVPPELAEITHRAMSRDQAHRYKNAGELRDALKEIIPDGPRMTPGLLKGIDPELRTYTAPRLTLSHDGILRATTRTGLSRTTASGTTSVPQPKVSTGAIAAATLGGVVLLAGGGFALFAGSGQAQSGAAPSVATVIVSAAPQVIEKTLVEERTFSLSIEPAGATATLDGKPLTAQDGKVEIQGVVGETRKVKLAFEGREIERELIITRDRLVPDRLEVPPKEDPKIAQRFVRKAGPTGAAPGEAKPAASPSPAPVAAPKIDTEFR